MENIKKKLGFGMMRLPLIGEEVDIPQTKDMVDAFLDKGFNYFDTAHGYLGGRSEKAVRECLTSRYPRESYILTDKLTGSFFNSQEEIRPLFASQLEACGVEYFDFYLMHCQTEKIFAHFKECRAYETALELKAEGKIRHFGISFHDSAAVLEQILTEYPQIEVVQIQLNYLDYEDEAVQSRLCLEVCRKFGKPVIVMEPVKGGRLATLPEEGQKVFDALGGGSNASYAVRFAASCPGVMMVLSGMSNREQMEDNTAFMADFQPLSEAEQQAVAKVCAVFRGLQLIQCTGCRYCVDQCPQGILIPNIFSCLNMQKVFGDWSQKFYYDTHTADGHAKASECLRCGACEAACPQQLPIRQLLETAAAEFEKE